jgi:hypothetical protein
MVRGELPRSARCCQEGDAAIAALIAAGANPDDLSIQLMPFSAEPTSAMHDKYRWDSMGAQPHRVSSDKLDEIAPSHEPPQLGQGRLSD